MNYFMGELNKIYNNLFNVYLLTSLITGLLAAIGFALFGVSYPFLWGLTTAIFALLPMIGPPMTVVVSRTTTPVSGWRGGECSWSMYWPSQLAANPAD